MAAFAGDNAKGEMVGIEPRNGLGSESQKAEGQKVNGNESKAEGLETEKDKVLVSENETKVGEEPKKGKPEEEEAAGGDQQENGIPKEVAVEIEPKSGVSFPLVLDDGKELNAVGVRKKSMLGMGIKIYGFGIYADNEKLKNLVNSKFAKAPAKATKELYQLVIDSDVEMMVRLVLVFSGLTMSMVKKNFDEGLGASIKVLTGGKKNDELSNKVMGQASDDIKLSPGSVIEISRLPGYILQTKVMGEIITKVESELLCRAYIQMYLGDDCLDKEAKQKFGASLLKLF
ncbi:hypothetical protein L6164_008959 [Bauhinia variegata]|uniref:Uncharacterized protein n=1 Tax=Bauhinia variegata TaxID=167791 RepID=A0ACB9PI38_BAUVA|nr:hypothetical protein L6164_008959 [Bauhinia variegata]